MSSVVSLTPQQGFCCCLGQTNQTCMHTMDWSMHSKRGVCQCNLHGVVALNSMSHTPQGGKETATCITWHAFALCIATADWKILTRARWGASKSWGKSSAQALAEVLNLALACEEDQNATWRQLPVYLANLGSRTCQPSAHASSGVTQRKC